MTDTHDMADVRVTFRLPRDSDQRMRQSAAFFARSMSAEWRAAAEVYRRVLALWCSSELGATVDGVGNEAPAKVGIELMTQLCAGLIRAPADVGDLLDALEAGEDAIE